jgi:hypothetical protein
VTCLDVATWLRVAFEWAGSDSAGNVGSLIGATATVAGVLLAGHQLHRWRRDRLDERRGDAAAGAYVSLIRACNLMRGYCELMSFHDTDPGVAVRNVRQLFDRIDARITDECFHRIHEILTSCVALLDDHETAPLSEAQTEANLFQNWMSGWSHRVSVAAEGDATARALAELRDKLQRTSSKFAAVERLGGSVLLPIARLRRK